MNGLTSGMLESVRGFVPFTLTFAFIVSFSLIIIYLITNSDYIRKQFAVKRFFWILLVFIILLGLGLRFATPHFYPTYRDEMSNIEVSKNIILYGQPLVCEYTGPEKISCRESSVSATFNYILSLFFILFGISTHSAYIATLIISLLAVIMVSVSVYLLFRNKKIALWSGFFISILPLYVLQSNTLEKDTAFVMLIFLTIFSFALLSKRMDFKTGVFAVVSLALAISTKQEGLILLPIFVAFVFLFADFDSIKKIHKNKKFWYLVILFAILMIPHFLHILIQIYPTLLYGKQTAYGEMGLENIRNNIWIFQKFAGVQYPWIFNLFIIIGILYSFKKFRKELVFLSLLFFFMTIAYLTYSYGVQERYLLMIYPPFIILGGIGVFYLENILTKIVLKGVGRKSFKKHISFAVSCVLVIMILFSFSPFFDKLDDTNPLDSSSGYTRDHLFYREGDYVDYIGRELGDSYVVAEFPLVFAGTLVKPIRTTNFLSGFEDTNPEELFGKIYYFEDLYCTDFYSLQNRCGLENQSYETCEALREEKINICKDMHKKFKLVTFSEYKFNVSENVRIRYGAVTGISTFRVYEIKERV